MVRRLEPEEHEPEQERNPFGYNKSIHSFTMRKMLNNPRNQGHWRYLPIVLPNPVVAKGISSFATKVSVAQIEPGKLKVVGLCQPVDRMGAPDTIHVSEKM